MAAFIYCIWEVLVEVYNSYYQPCWCCEAVDATTTHSTFSVREKKQKRVRMDAVWQPPM